MDLYDLWFAFVEKMEEHATKLARSAEFEDWRAAVPEAEVDLLMLAFFIGKYENCGCFTESARSWREHHDALARALTGLGYLKEASMLGMAAELEDQIWEQDDPAEPGPALEAAAAAMEEACSIDSQDIMEKILADPTRFAIDPRELIQEPFTGRTGSK